MYVLTTRYGRGTCPAACFLDGVYDSVQAARTAIRDTGMCVDVFQLFEVVLNNKVSQEMVQTDLGACDCNSQPGRGDHWKALQRNSSSDSSLDA